MELFNSKIESCLKDTLDSSVPSVRFNAVWDRYKKNSPKTFGIKRVIAVPLLALIVLIVGFTFGGAKTDKTDYPFVNDPNVIGKWKAVDYINNIDQFIPGQQIYNDDLIIKSLAFINNGHILMACSNGNSNLAPTDYTWTHGLVIDIPHKTAGKYETKEINGSTYMFMEWKNGDYIYLHRKPSYFVFKQVDNKDYSNAKITVVKEDKVDYPFVDDPQLIGKWECINFVKTIDGFNPSIRMARGDLFLSQFDIAENGKMSILLSNQKVYEESTWTKGLVLDKKCKTASKYEIKEIKGDSYLFYEFKNGNYTYNGREPQYYVLKKLK